SRATVEALERRRVQEQGPHHMVVSPSALNRPPAVTRSAWPRQVTLLPQKLASSTTNDKAARSATTPKEAGVRLSARATPRASQSLAAAATARTPSIAIVPPPKSTAAKASATVWVTIDAANAVGAMVRIVRPHRNSCRNNRS